MTKKWVDFTVSEEDRAYCQAKWNLAHLADVFAPEVIQHYIQIAPGADLAQGLRCLGEKLSPSWCVAR